MLLGGDRREVGGGFHGGQEVEFAGGRRFAPESWDSSASHPYLEFRSVLPCRVHVSPSGVYYPVEGNTETGELCNGTNAATEYLQINTRLDLRIILLLAAETSLVITAHRHSPMLERCLDAVSVLNPAPARQIVVVDGCDRRVAESACDKGFEVLVLENAPGVSAARNAGAFLAKTRFVAFLDSDVVPFRNHIEKAIAALQSQPGAVAAFGSYDDSPAASGLVSRYRNLLHHFTHQNARRDAQSFWAACGICDGKVFRQVGGFDETYRVPCIEDIALGYKLRRAGHRIALDPAWQIKHLKQWTWRDLVFTDIGRRAIPWTLLLLREGRLDNDLNIDTRSRWSALLVMTSLSSLAGGLFSVSLLAIPAVCLAGAIFLNRRFYQFLAHKEGWPFAIGAIPFHLFYYLAATIGWVSGHAIFIFQRMLRKK